MGPNANPGASTRYRKEKNGKQALYEVGASGVKHDRIGTVEGTSAFRNVDCTTRPHAMNIRLVSTLTPEDEARIAEALCLAAGTVLDHLEIAYTLRIETTDGQVFQQHKTPPLAAVRASSSVVAT